jgi:hypothetical protein
VSRRGGIDLATNEIQLSLGCDFVVEYTNKQINKSPFSVSANVFSFAHRLMCICLDRKVILLANTQIHITK